VRRIVAIAILFLLGSFDALPLLQASTGREESNLPACCRHHGRHRCAMMDDDRKRDSNGSPQLAAAPQRCPLFPHSLPAVGVTLHAAPPASAALYAGLTSHPAIHPQIQAAYRLSLDRARQKRGPPVQTVL